MGARRATVTDVAAAAGVSRSTASRALTGTGYVGRGVRERVQHAADRLGYVPDAMARNLRQRVSRSIGLLVPDASTGLATGLVAGVIREAGRRGYATVLVGDAAGDVDEAQAAERLVALRVAGVVVAPSSVEVTAHLARLRTPVVEVGRQLGHELGDVVVTDEAGSAREVVAHLLALGHRRVALLVDRVEPSTGHDPHVQGVLAACREAGLPDDAPLVLPTPDDPGAARAAALALLGSARPPTAVCAASERLAAGVWRAAGERGLRVPADLSLVALADAAWMEMVTPAVTAVVHDPVALGRTAVSRLLARLDGADGMPTTSVLPGAIVHRGSTGPPTGHDSVPRLSHTGATAGQSHL